MTDRRALGEADVTDDELARMVGQLLGVPPEWLHLDCVRVTPVDYGLASLTTAARHRVTGTALVQGHPQPFSLFVKHLRAFERAPEFQDIPTEFRETAAASLPWDIETHVYRSDLREHLPAGLAMPRAVRVHDIDATSAALWLEDIPTTPVDWDIQRFRRAATLLGQLAGSPAVAPYADVGGYRWDVSRYLAGRLTHQVLPMLRSGIWEHPLIAASFDGDLRQRLLAAADLVGDYVAELKSFPLTTGHGDACPNNMLVRPGSDDAFTLIDFGFWHELPIGFDLGQLLVGDVQIGRRGSEDLAERDELCLEAYVEGLATAGMYIPLNDVRRAHALHLFVFSGISSLPFEHLACPVDDALVALAADRAAIARYSLELLDSTA